MLFTSDLNQQGNFLEINPIDCAKKLTNRHVQQYFPSKKKKPLNEIDFSIYKNPFYQKTRGIYLVIYWGEVTSVK